MVVRIKPILIKAVLAIILAFFYLQLPYFPSPIPSLQSFPESLSFIQLMANPLLFHNRKIRAIGFVVLEYENSS
ncbi:MAG: hypothetical protein AAGA60_06690, partial [Cyanobacteria bacterium P01_E01_bin.42]